MQFLSIIRMFCFVIVPAATPETAVRNLRNKIQVRYSASDVMYPLTSGSGNRQVPVFVPHRREL